MTTCCAVSADDVEIILGLPGAIVASLAVVKNVATLVDGWMDGWKMESIHLKKLNYAETKSNQLNFEELKKYTCRLCKVGVVFRLTLVQDAGVTLIQNISTAGYSVAHFCSLRWALTCNLLVLTAGTTHGVPLWAGTLILQQPKN